MSIMLESCRGADLGALRALIAEPSIESEFAFVQAPGELEHKLTSNFCVPEASLLARAAGEPAGICVTYLLPRANGGSWAALRVAVAARHRRRGIGRALFDAARAALAAREIPGGLRELALGAWRPNAEGTAFAASLGFRHARCFWRMERALEPVPDARWPEGVTLRVFDGSERAMEDWTEAYNDSFAEHYHFVPGTMEHCREIVSDPTFLHDGVAFAYRDRRCVGFCRNQREGRAGVIGALGTVRAARGIGLGRALLRWGVGYFAARDYDRVELLVDGENESALALYRSEAFAVARTRDIWTLEPLPR